MELNFHSVAQKSSEHNIFVVYNSLMSPVTLISNERQARETAALIEQIGEALSSEQTLKSIVEGLPREVIDGVRRSLSTERQELAEILAAYQNAKEGDFELLKRKAENDLGEVLIVARIAKDWSQKDLARKLGLREQAIQRYESERYRSISLAGYIRVARALDVDLAADIRPVNENRWAPSFEVSPAEAQKVLKHARAHGWLQGDNGSDENGISQLVKHVAEHVEMHGTPSLLRTGLNVKHHSEDWTLLSWKAQVTRKAKAVIDRDKLKYRPLDVSWLKDLVRLSKLDDGPAQAGDLLRQHGIVLIAERNIPGMNVDGAAFLVDHIPVIGLTLLRDALDNFWFTLMHEVGHVILHYRTGLAAGFFDDVESVEVDEFEEEANRFASNMLIPEELWSRSPARIAKTADPIERFADQLGISPAIVFGRIRMERKNYALFSDKIGRNKVRRQLLSQP
ncbi:HTH-type transcriptional regulator/antitoxin HigA [Paraburkholderia sp. HC6.4b]|uniref:XRE family transcriptional regulator n=1 Tax=unclassified Paraburkholderia TaxID=2615204 RepID=UPI0017A9114A|nr:MULTISPECIES: XRE family transcriptional regulator [unclassified Paraburkholderia]MBB5412160.1 HTH-type transcriptional regulator/antitoxin HigA [Paraburkholderia sp. HC6.4b]MBB5454227.1 HTH-type transcriptional regulator/antitoxin HigA [Paraburkholderia sp. Kb1A]